MNRTERIAARDQRRTERAAAAAGFAGFGSFNPRPPSPARPTHNAVIERQSKNHPSRISARNPPPHFPQPQDTTPFLDGWGRPLHLQGLYRGCSLFLVLSGPSLTALDLSLLDQRGIVTMGVNNSPAVVRPNIWTHVDPPQKFHESIWLDPAVLKVVNKRRAKSAIRTRLDDGRLDTMIRPILNEQGERTGQEPVRARDMPGVIFDNRNANFQPDSWLDEPSTNWGNNKEHAAKNGRPHCLNVFIAALKIAYSLGFRTVYLLGCDFRMSADRPYAFPEAKDTGAANGNNGTYQKLNVMLGELKPRFDRAGFRVLNCNPNSGLTVFPFCEYKTGIETAIQNVPQDPLDTVGWYKKN